MGTNSSASSRIFIVVFLAFVAVSFYIPDMNKLYFSIFFLIINTLFYRFFAEICMLFLNPSLLSESESEVAQPCLTLCDPMDTSLHQAPLSMGFSRQEYWISVYSKGFL